MVGVTTTWGTVLKDHSLRKVEDTGLGLSTRVQSITGLGTDDGDTEPHGAKFRNSGILKAILEDGGQSPMSYAAPGEQP